MANISSIKLPNGTTYNLKDNGALPLTGGAVTGPVTFGDSISVDEATLGDLIVNGSASFTNGVKAANYNGGQPTYTVIGTQTAATGSWTGNINASALYDGMRILYYLPYAGSGNATLNLTLSDGTTTGAINCYLYANTRLTTHYGAGFNFHLTYWSAGSIKINGVATTDDRWVVDAQYWSNTVSQLRHDYSVVYAGTSGIFPYTLIMMNKDGNYESIVTSSSLETSKTKNTAGFLPGRLLLYYTSGTTTNGNKITASNYGLYEGYSGFDARYSFNITTTGLTVGKPVYLVGTITNGLFYLADTWWTQTLPTTADGKVYMYVGQVYNIATVATDYRVNIEPYHPMYQYTNGALRLFGGDAATINGLTVQTAVPANAVFTDSTVSTLTLASGSTAGTSLSHGGKYTLTAGTKTVSFTMPSDNNTTYTFANGTNGFTVTPSGGSAQTVTVTPSITNNITGSGTSGYIAKFSGANTLTNGPAIGSDTTKFLRNDGTWAEPPGSGSTISYVTKSENTYTTTSSSSISTIPIGIQSYTSTDVLLVDINGLDLIQGTDYTISGTNIVLTTPITTSGTKVHFTALKMTTATTSDYATLKGEKGDDGHSPVVTASKSGTTTTVYVDGSSIASINDGTNGTHTISYTPIVTGGAQIGTITIDNTNYPLYAPAVVWG